MAKSTKTTAKDAKTEIKKAQSEATAKSAAKKALVSDIHADEKKAKAKAQKEAADAFIKSEFVSEAIKEKYAALEAEIADKTATLKELYGIEAEGMAIADMVNAHNLTQDRLNEEAAAAEKERKDAHEALVATQKAELETLKRSFADAKKSLEDGYKAHMEDLKNQRMREAEEFQYNLERSRSKENDEWADEKAKREKVMAEKEADLEKRLAEVAEREAKMNDLETKVAEFPEKLKEATETGKAAGKAESDKSHAFEKRYMEQDAKNKETLLQSTIDGQEKTIKAQEATISELQAKLDKAYERNQELSIAVAQNGGKTTIVTANDAQGATKK